MKTFSIQTLGCRVNQYESQVIREGLLQKGLRETSFGTPADITVINTCAVTAESARKSKQALRRALRGKQENPDALVCVCGCFSQGAGADDVFALADVVAGNTGKGSLAACLATLSETPFRERNKLDLREEISRRSEYEKMSLSSSHNARAFVKIQDGCNSFCSYCYVPLVRGRARSRGVEEIRDEIISLARNGYGEVVLTGIETGAWGEDFPGHENLASLVEEIHEIPGILRIRFGSLKPSVFTEEFTARLAALPKVMPHFHLSLQSGSDSVLAAMGRKYGRREEEAAVATVMRHFPDAGLSADLICGFPGELEEDFLETLSLVEQTGLLHTHIFPYSPRKGTRAYERKDDVSAEEKKRRCAHLLEKAREMSEKFAEKRLGKSYEIYCERIRDGFAFGYTQNFIYTKTPALPTLSVGDVFKATLTGEKNFSVETMTVLGKEAKQLTITEKKCKL